MQHDEVYTIDEHDVLESLREDLDRRRKPARNSERGGTDSATARASPRRAAGIGSETRPLVAGTMSLFLLGAGQLYNRQLQLGLLFFLTEALAVSAHWALGRAWNELVALGDLFGVTEWGLFLGVASADLLFLLLVLGGVLQAYRQAERDVGSFEGAGGPMAAGLASFVIPGWGQLVNGQLGKALVFLFALLSGAYVATMLMFSPFMTLLEQVRPGGEAARQAGTVAVGILGAAGIMWMLSVYDAVLVAGYRRRGF